MSQSPAAHTPAITCTYHQQWWLEISTPWAQQQRPGPAPQGLSSSAGARQAAPLGTSSSSQLAAAAAVGLVAVHCVSQCQPVTASQFRHSSNTQRPHQMTKP